ncbi:hypothetical protein [Catenulispora rubra]|nr:hypothetical protein [Catenulispora rubra]
MNLFQWLIGVWWSLWAAARGLDMTRDAADGRSGHRRGLRTPA